MIDIEKAGELHSTIADLLRNEQLLTAFTKMRVLAEEAADWNLRSEFENMEVTYHRMLQFMTQDMIDPDRGRMYYQLIVKGLILNDRLYRAILTQTSSALYYKEVRELLKRPHFSTFYEMCEWVRKMLPDLHPSAEGYVL